MVEPEWIGLHGRVEPAEVRVERPPRLRCRRVDMRVDVEHPHDRGEGDLLEPELDTARADLLGHELEPAGTFGEPFADGDDGRQAAAGLRVDAVIAELPARCLDELLGACGIGRILVQALGRVGPRHRRDLAEDRHAAAVGRRGRRRWLVEAVGQRLAKVALEEEPAGFGVEIEVETQEAQLRVLSDLEVRVALDRVVGGVVERELPVDVTAREGLSGLAGGRERPERHALDRGCAEEVVLVGDELEARPPDRTRRT